MKEKTTDYLFQTAMLLFTATIVLLPCSISNTVAGSKREGATIESNNEPQKNNPPKNRVDTTLTDRDFFAALDLSTDEMTAVRRAVEGEKYGDAAEELADYFRKRPLKGHWWNASIEPLDETTGSRAYQAFERMVDKQPPFDENKWNDDGSFNWNNVSSREQRMYFFSSIGNACRHSNDKKVVDMFVNLYGSWIAQFPYDGTNKNPGWATMVSGIRLRTGWGDAFAAFSKSDHWKAQDMLLFLKSFYEQAVQLRNHHSRTSNWLTFELAGLYGAGVLFPEFKDAGDWRNYAIQTALDDIEQGWLPDGMSIELSPGYGQFFVNFLWISDLANETGQADTRAREIVRKCENLFTPYLQLMMPNRLTPALNDNRAVDVPKFLANAAERFPRRKDFQWTATNGKTAAAPQFLSLAFPYAGYAVIRSGWQSDDNYLCFVAGPIGYRHANQHKLSIVLNAYGREIIYDPGASAYGSGANELYQQYVYDTFSHSTGLVDNRPQRRRWYQNPHPNNMPYKEAEDFEYQISGGRAWARGLYKDHYGRAGSIGNDAYPYKKGGNFNDGWEKPATHQRQIFYIEPDIFLVQDIFTPNDNQEHQYEIRWQIDSVNTQFDGSIFKTKDDKQPNLAVVPLWTDGIEVEAIVAQNEPEVMGWKVIDADNPKPATTLRHAKSGAGKKEFLTLLFPIKPNSDFGTATFEGKPRSAGTLRLSDGRTIQIAPADDNNRLRAVIRGSLF